jgi:hypothetical protein
MNAPEGGLADQIPELIENILQWFALEIYKP